MRAKTAGVLFVLIAAPASASGVSRIADIDRGTYVSKLEVARAPGGFLAAAWTVGMVGTDLVTGLATSSDGGVTWKTRVSPAHSYYLHVAASGSATVDLVAGDWSSPTHFRSLDGGVTWSFPHALPAIDWLDDVPEVRVAVSESGTIAVMGGMYTGPRTVGVVLSDDGGDSWRPQVDLAIGNSVNGKPTLAWTGPLGLVACWSEDAWVPAKHSAILCRRSVDGGLSFNPAVEALGSALGSTVDYFVGSLVRRAPGDVVLAVSSAAGLWAAHSADGGATWSAPATLDAVDRWARPSVTADPAGRVWIATSVEKPGYFAPRSLLATSTDGDTWSATSLPPDLPGCRPFPYTPAVLAGSTSEVVFVGEALDAWRSTDAGATWGTPFGLAGARSPVRDTYAIELAGGRLVSLWLHGAAEPTELRTSASDDGGLTWSPPRVVSDAVPSLRETKFAAYSLGYPLEYPLLHATPLRGGGAIALWNARSGSSCVELRASPSSDGQAWAASVPLGAIDRPPFSTVEDVTGSVVAAWVAGGNLVAARSLDSGLTWTPPATVRSPQANTSLLVSGLVSLADGSIAIAVLHDGNGTAGALLEIGRSFDGGIVWSFATLETASTTPYRHYFGQPLLVSAGPRVVIATAHRWCCCGECEEELLNKESFDVGATWTKFDGWLYSDLNTVGDALGNLYQISNYFPYVMSWAPSGSLEFKWQLPPSAQGAVPSPVVVASGKVGVVFPDAYYLPSPPGLFYTEAPCGVATLTLVPKDRDVCSSQSTTFLVEAAPEPGLTYQWYWNGAPISGATAPDYTTVVWSVPGSDGSYTCRVTNGCGWVETQPAYLNVLTAPSLMSWPAAGRVCAGRPLSLSLFAEGSGLSYAWSKDGTPIPGATSPSYDVALVAAADAGDYTCEVSNACGVRVTPPSRVQVAVVPDVVGGTLLLHRDRGDVVFTWTDLAGADSYEVGEDSSRSGTFAVRTGSAASGGAGLRVALPAAGAVFYRVGAANLCGSGPK